MKFLSILFFGIFPLFQIDLAAENLPNSSSKSIGASPKIISLLHKIDNTIDGAFHIESVIDERDFKKNIGLAHRYLDRPLVVDLLLNKTFLEDLQVACNRWKPEEEESQAFKLKIHEIYIWDYLHQKREKRYAKVSLEFLNEDNESFGIFTTTVAEKGEYKRFSHEGRLERAFWESINKFARQLKQSRNKTSYSFEGKKRENPPYGVAFNFLDLKNQDLEIVRPLLEKTVPGELYRYRPISLKEFKSEYYAYWNNGEIFIKATNYANSGAYFVRVLEQGKYWFLIDKVNIQALSQDLFDESIVDEFFNVVVGIVIDSESGLPQFVTDEFLKEFLAPYPDLAEKYLIVGILKYPFQLDRVRRLIAEINQRLELSEVKK